MPRNKTEYLIIHCSATRPSQDIDVRTIDRWHRERGFLKVGYHAVITRAGELQTGRQENETGAHCKKYNHLSLGVCVVGGVTQDDHTIPENNFTDEQWKTLKEYVTNIKEKYPDIKVIGHNEVSSKACPSFNVQEWLVTEGFKKPVSVTTPEEKEELKKFREATMKEGDEKFKGQRHE